MDVFQRNLAAQDISPHYDAADIHLMPASRFEHYKLVHGHFSVLKQAEFCRSRYSATLLRDPLRRIFSAYTFWRSEPYDPLTAKAKEFSFAEFVRYFVDSPSIVHNAYAFHLAALGRDCVAYPPDEDALLAAAKHNLAAYDFVGVCEEMDRSVRLLCAELGWPPPATTPHENRTASGERLNEIDAETIQLLRDRNRLDFELYNYAVELLNAREAAAGMASHRPDGVERNHLLPFPLPLNPNRPATIHSVSADWVGDENTRAIEIAVKFRTAVPIQNLCLGFQLSSAEGDVVAGTNTDIACLELHYEPGFECVAAFQVECLLPAGLYYVTIALSELRRLGFHDHWIDYATCFHVPPEREAVSKYVRGIRFRKFTSEVLRD